MTRGQQQTNTTCCQHTLLHWKPLLVISTRNANYIALENTKQLSAAAVALMTLLIFLLHTQQHRLTMLFSGPEEHTLGDIDSSNTWANPILFSSWHLNRFRCFSGLMDVTNRQTLSVKNQDQLLTILAQGKDTEIFAYILWGSSIVIEKLSWVNAITSVQA